MRFAILALAASAAFGQIPVPSPIIGAGGGGGGGTGCIPVGTNGQLLVDNGSGACTSLADFTFTTHTLAGGAAALFDMSAATGTNAFKVPVGAGRTATANGAIDYDSTNNMLHAAQAAADAFIPQFTITPTNGDCAVWVVSGANYKLGDAPCGSGSGTVTSVGAVGTANQITVSGASPITGAGTFTFSLPSTLIAPGTLQVTGNLTVNATGSTQCLQANTSGVVSGTGSACGSGGGGNTTSTSLTNNVLPKANGANSIINSSVSDDGTTVSTTEPIAAPSVSTGSSPPAVTAGTGGGVAWGEGTCPSAGLPAASVDGICSRASDHALVASFNNDALSQLARFSNNLSVFAATTSAQLAGVISDETGTGALVFGTGPTIGLVNATGLPAGGLAAVAADNIFGNFTAGSAIPSTQALPSCAADGSHAITYASHTLGCTPISGGGGTTVSPRFMYVIGQPGYNAGTTAPISPSAPNMGVRWPFTVMGSTLSATGIWVTTAPGSAPSFTSLAVYNDAMTTKLCETTPFSTATTGDTLGTWSSACVLPPAPYWMVTTSSNTAVQFNCYHPTNEIQDSFAYRATTAVSTGSGAAVAFNANLSGVTWGSPVPATTFITAWAN